MAAMLILLSGCTGLVEGILIKKYNAKHKKGGFFFTGLVSLFSMLFFVFTDQNGFYFPAGIFPYALLSGALFCTASFLTYLALGCGPFSISMLILSYSCVFSIVYGLIFLRETADVFTYAGLLLIMISLYLTRGQASVDEDKKASLKWGICIGLSVACSGMFGVLMRMQQIAFDNACTNEYMIITLGCSSVVLLIVGVVRDRHNLAYILRHGSGYAALSGISNGATNFMGLAINLLMPLSISSPIRAGVRIILSFALSKIIFKERLLTRQLIGVILGGIALVMLNF